MAVASSRPDRSTSYPAVLRVVAEASMATGSPSLYVTRASFPLPLTVYTSTSTLVVPALRSASESSSDFGMSESLDRSSTSVNTSTLVPPRPVAPWALRSRVW